MLLREYDLHKPGLRFVISYNLMQSHAISCNLYDLHKPGLRFVSSEILSLIVSCASACLYQVISLIRDVCFA